MKHSFVLIARWKRRDRDDMQFCDDGSKFVDDCDFALSAAAFAEVQSSFGVCHDVDRFATRANRRTERFFSRFWCRGAAGVDSFTHDWDAPVDGQRPMSWVHPPRAMACRALRHAQLCGARGTFVLPLDRREVWWPVVSAGAAWITEKDGAERRLTLRRARGLLCRGGAFGDDAAGSDGPPLPAGHRDLLVVNIDFRGHGSFAPALHLAAVAA
jgi:hypothetical protein